MLTRQLQKIFDINVILIVYTLAAKSFKILEIVMPRPQAASATIFLSVR
jgi:hypothetical protein